MPATWAGFWALAEASARFEAAVAGAAKHDQSEEFSLLIGRKRLDGEVKIAFGLAVASGGACHALDAREVGLRDDERFCGMH